MQRHLFRILNEVQRPDIWPLALRRALLRTMGLRLEAGTMVLAQADIVQGPLRIGAGAFLNRGCYLDASGGIDIGARVHLGPGVKLLTASHAPGPPDCRAGPSYTAPITIGDGAWIGAGAIVLAGVTIGRGAIVAAGSVVVADADGNTLHAGVPAGRKRALDGQ